MHSDASTSSASYPGNGPFNEVRVGEIMTMDRKMVAIDPIDRYASIGIKSYGVGIFHYPPRSGLKLGKLRFFRLRPGCLIVSNIMAWEGAVAITTEADAECVASSRFLPYFPDPTRADLRYLKYYFATGPGHIQIQWASTGTAKRNRTLGIDRFERIKFPLPPLPEQKKIAAILSSVDQAIQATQAVIEQTRRVKEGLLQDLLTRGIGRGGKLRDGHSGARFKQTEIGEIPEGWEVVRLGSILETIEGGRSPSAPNEPAQGNRWGVLKVSAVGHGVFVARENKCLPADFSVPENHKVRPGDVLITRANTASLVGACCRVPDGDYRLMLCDKTLRLVPDTARVSANFMCEVVGSPRARSYFASVATGSSASMKNISQPKMRALRLALPPMAEQREIVARLHAVQDDVEVNVRTLAHMNKAKEGLLQDLLTGKVRVSV